MAIDNVYAPPSAKVSDLSGGIGTMSDRIVTALRKTRPWVLFMSVLGFIGTAFMAIAGVGMILGGGFFAGEEFVGAGAGAAAFMGMGIMYLVFAALYFFISLYLVRYASAIKRAVASLSASDLESALESQASFWKLAGIMTLVMIVGSIGLAVLTGVGSVMMQ